MRLVKTCLLVTGALWSSVIATHAQSTTGTITGRIADTQELAVPGVTVTVTSASLQGTRSTVSSETGDYVVPLLPPGTYTITFDLTGFAKVVKTTSLAPTQVLPVDAILGPAAIQQDVLVAASSAQVLTRTALVATDFRQDLIAALPTNRDINASLLLAPSVHPTGPGGGYSIGGSMSFENLFMVNGVAVTDNVRGQAYDLYIEDAIQQTTIATAGISAEYGRFSGGVVNVITKSGGNSFSGSLRNTLVNDKWRTLTPFEDITIEADPAHKDTRVDVTVPTYEYTLGGAVLRDRLWFFAAGRNQRQESGRALVGTNLPYTFESRQSRYEGKATYSAIVNHRVQGSFIRSFDEQVNQSQNPATAMDLASLFTAKRPMNLFTVEYSGVMSPAFFVEARFSVRNETLEDVGARATDLVNGTLLVDREGRRFWSPTFCGVCGAEERDGQDLFLKGTYFLSSRGVGSHTMTFGYDGYNNRRYANNHQSGSDYRILNVNSIIRDTDITAQFIGDGATLIQWQPIFVTSEGTNFRTHSAFYSDNWRVSDRVTAVLGLRYDHNDAVDSSGMLVAKGNSWSPRLGMVVDPRGDQQWTISGSVAKYVGALANTVANAASAAGNADAYQFVYLGPDVNADTSGVLTSTAEGIRQVFDWFNANGGASRPTVLAIPVGVTPIIGDDLESPSAWEYAGGISRQVGNRAAVRADVTYRDYGNFYAQRTDISTGRVIDTRAQAPASVRGHSYDLTVIENTDLLTRQYAGLGLQANYRFGVRANAGATYTLARAWGNVDGETGAGPSASAALQYPEYKRAGWNYPDGDLSIDQRHRARLWLNYGLPAVSGLTLSVMQILESGVPYGAMSNAGVNPRPYVTNPGYLSPPVGTGTLYYFTARDAFRTEGQRRTDLAVSYARSVKGLRGLQFFGQLQVLNVFDDFQLCACGAPTVFKDGGAMNSTFIDQAVRTSVTNAALRAFDPFTTTPVENVNWARGPNFGRALNRLAYTTPRTLRLTFGVRF
ncbi:MAG: hypothetical protein GEU82_11905 [Luteitalea sp.]|nr:hypothetical protein [Luteitalea sp.]